MVRLSPRLVQAYFGLIAAPVWGLAEESRLFRWEVVPIGGALQFAYPDMGLDELLRPCPVPPAPDPRPRQAVRKVRQ